MKKPSFLQRLTGVMPSDDFDDVLDNDLDDEVEVNDDGSFCW